MVRKYVLLFFAGLILLVFALVIIQSLIFGSLSGHSITSSSINELEKFQFLAAEYEAEFAYLTFQIYEQEKAEVSLGYTFYDVNGEVIKSGEDTLIVESGKSLHVLKLSLPRALEGASVTLSAYIDGEFKYETRALQKKKVLLSGRVIGSGEREKYKLLPFIGLLLAIAFIIVYLIHARLRKRQLESFDVWIDAKNSRNMPV